MRNPAPALLAGLLLIAALVPLGGQAQGTLGPDTTTLWLSGVQDVDPAASLIPLGGTYTLTTDQSAVSGGTQNFIVDAQGTLSSATFSADSTSFADPINLDAAGTIDLHIRLGAGCCASIGVMEATLTHGDTELGTTSWGPQPFTDYTEYTANFPVPAGSETLDPADGNIEFTLSYSGAGLLFLETGREQDGSTWYSKIELPVIAGTDDVNTNDADEDGLPDDWEEAHFGGLNEDGSGDPDDDGLNNTEEESLGTDPTDDDTDGDGVTDGDEVANGTDPKNPDDPGSANDADQDGLDDDWEAEHFGDATAEDGSGDPDGDGLNNTEEQTHGTDPNSADSDGDGIDDGDEVAAGTNPNDATDPASEESEETGSEDTDGDGLNGTQEAELGTDPDDADSDGDGHSDGEEVEAGSNPLDADDTPQSSDDDDLDALQELEDDWAYLAISGGALVAVIVLSIIALAVRWA